MGAFQNNKYKEIKQIGRGGCGVVYLVQKDNKYYALKKIPLLTKDELQNYQKLLNILTKIKSEHIIKYYESYMENDCLCIIMEYGGNKDLKKYIDEQNHLIDEKIIKDIIIQICLGLKEIHKNKLIHADLTPDNIFMDENKKIKIGDFSVSRILTTNKKFTKSQVGKFHYFAPEIEKGEEYNNKVDIYSLGCIIYELFTLNEYYNVKYENKNKNINIDIYNPKWQNLIDLTLNSDFNKRPTIDEIYNLINNEIYDNEIICNYKKYKDEVNILINFELEGYLSSKAKWYKKARDNINGDNIEIYINDKKIKFNYKYASNEKGLIKIKFKFKKLLTSTASMFSGCDCLESIDLSSFNSKNVTDMSNMFRRSSIEYIDLSSLDTNQVTDMSCMFSCCKSLKSINLSSLNTKNVTDMSCMFSGCTSLKSLNLSSFNTENVNNMNKMFSYCFSLKTINLSSFNTSKVNYMGLMFLGCRCLESLDLISFKTSIMTDVGGMFEECSSLKNIKINEKEKKIAKEFSSHY